MQKQKPQWLENTEFHSVINLPSDYYIHDFTEGDDPIPDNFQYSVGRYNEVRKEIYRSEIFLEGQRNIHMGIDIAGPVNEPVHSFCEGVLYKFTNNSSEGDYGPTLVYKHEINGQTLYALYGHLSLGSLKNKKEGQSVKKGEVIGWLGDRSVNGGWFPHVHFQLSLKQPIEANLPGVVAAEDHIQALKDYPDPRWVLGPLYQDKE